MQSVDEWLHNFDAMMNIVRSKTESQFCLFIEQTKVYLILKDSNPESVEQYNPQKTT